MSPFLFFTHLYTRIGHRLPSFFYLIFILCPLFYMGCTEDPGQTKRPITKIKKLPPPFVLSGNPNHLPLTHKVVSFGGTNLLKSTFEQCAKTAQTTLSTTFDLRAMWLNNYVQTEFLFPSKYVFFRTFRVFRPCRPSDLRFCAQSSRIPGSRPQ